MKNKKQERELPFVYKKRRKALILLTIVFLATFVYLHYLIEYVSLQNFYKYYILMLPAFSLGFAFTELSDIFWYVQKGISGENRVEKLLKRIDYKYYRNVTVEEFRFDYDFIVQKNEQLLVVEVKNHKRVNVGNLKSIAGKLAFRCKLLKEYLEQEYPGKYKWVEGVVVVVNGRFEKDKYKKDVLAFDELEEWLREYFE